MDLMHSFTILQGIVKMDDADQGPNNELPGVRR